MTKRVAAGMMAVGLTVLTGLAYQKEVIAFQNPNVLQERPDNNRWPVRFNMVRVHQELGFLTRGALKQQDDKKQPAQPEAPKAYATLVDVKSVVDRLQSGQSPRCPEQGMFTYNLTADTASRLCLATKNIVVVEPVNGGQPGPVKIVFDLASDPAFQKIIDLPATVGAAKPEECRDLLSRLTAYGHFLLDETQGLPHGASVEVQLATQGGSVLTCI